MASNSNIVVTYFAVFGFKTTFSNHFTDYVAIIDLTGIIRDDHKLRAVLNKIEHNKMARALILRINSPGGTMVGAEGYIIPFAGSQIKSRWSQ